MGFFILMFIVLLLTAGGFVWGRAASSEGLGWGAWLSAGSIIGGIILGLIVIAGFSFHTVENGHIGIVKTFSSVTGTTGDGFVTTAPWQSISQVSVQNEIRTYDMNDKNNSAVSSDSQDVFLIAQVNYSLQRDCAVDLFKETGGDYVNRILDPAVYQNVKEVTAQYRATEFAKNRETIRQDVEKKLKGEISPTADGSTTANGKVKCIGINNVTLKNVSFTDALTKAIEQTVEAEQQAKRAEAQVKIKTAEANQAIATAKGEATANITRATGEARANKLRSKSLSDLVLRSIELDNQREAIDKLNPDVQVIVCPPRTVCIPNSTVGTPGG